MRTAVIGQGPASLAAAWAVYGLDPWGTIDFFGPGEPSRIRGAVVLHEPIPGITLTHPDGYVSQHVVGGHIDDYGQKLYGDIHVNRSGDPFRKGFHTWRVEETYDEMWKVFRDYPQHVGQVDNFQLERISAQYDFVVNTAPANLFCTNRQHQFREVSLDLTWELMQPGQQDNTVFYNADPLVPWARSASIFGSVVTEWAPGRCTKQHHTITKPLGTDCDCHPDVFRTGRYGAWDNTAWIETAYYGTRERLLNV